MKKIYLVIAGAFLLILIITSMLLSLKKKPTINTQKNPPFPTSVPRQDSISQQTNQQANQQNNQTVPNTTSQIIELPYDISTFAPVETADFKMQFNTQLNKLVVEKKTSEGEQKFADWSKQNNYPQLIGNSDKVFLADPGQAPHNFNPMLDLFSIFTTFGRGTVSSTGQGDSATANPDSVNPAITSSPTLISSNSGKPTRSSIPFTYFAQCGDLSSLPLPDGCTLCNAGCGPTTVAMIASSYLGPKYDLKAIVNLYDSNNYLLGCDGSRYTDAHELLKSLGLKTTDYLVFESEKAETVVPDLRKYLSSGWTFFTLASFCEGGCGHYFWITDIDDQGNIFAYDPAYGRYEIPYNENSRYPYPLYRLAFGVKK